MRGCVVVAGWLAVVGCGDFASPSSLEHAQIVAVRASPPRLMGGERARIDVLASLDDGTVLEIGTPTIAGALAHTDEGGAFVLAPPGIDAPLTVPIEVSVDLAGEIKRAEKVVVLGASGGNPSIGGVFVDSAPVEGPIEVAVGSRPVFIVSAEGEGELTFAWYSSVGDLGFYRSHTMELRADAVDEGHLVVVVRDALGGTEWRVLEVSVR